MLTRFTRSASASWCLSRASTTEVRHRYCPYQSLDNEGRLTANSMIGYPIHVLTLRDVPDDNHVPSRQLDDAARSPMN